MAKMNFCEQCGAALAPNVRFCEECGAAVEEYQQSASEELYSKTGKNPSISLLASVDWASKWRQEAERNSDCELGLILTRERSLLNHLAIESAQFRGMISDYIDESVNRGIRYFYLNLDEFPEGSVNGRVESVVNILRRITKVAKPKYIFILGNEDVVDVAQWDNLAEDGDESVESDLCYMTLDIESPWEGQQYDFDNVIRVGRLPTYARESFSRFKAYFDGVSQYCGRLNRIIPYGLSALVWENESNYEFDEVSLSKVDTSPDVECGHVSSCIGKESNLLFFNLHGSDDTKFWYGQEGGNYPKAFSPQVIGEIKRPYVLGVEACYGARYLEGLTPEDSILLKALENNCLSFLGSSRIAYGTCNPKGSCADFVVGSFIKSIARGETAGDAHVNGLKRLTYDWDAMDDADIKTMAEFALYGDPSVRMYEKSVAARRKSDCECNNAIQVPIPDVRRAVRATLSEVDAKINAIIDSYVAREVLPELAGSIGTNEVKTKVLRMSNTGLKQKIYIHKTEMFRRVAKIYFDDNGRISKALVSK